MTVSTTTSNDTLTLQLGKNSSFAISKKEADSLTPAGYAKTLASAYLKFTKDGGSMEETDSAQSFVSLYSLHNELTEQAEAYLASDVPFVYEGQPVQPLLLNFSAFRITLASREYLAATVQDKPSEEIAAIKTRIQDYQKEYDAILQLA